MAQRVQEFCTDCGERLVGGACLWHAPPTTIQLLNEQTTSSSSWKQRGLVALLLAMMTVGWGLTFQALSSTQDTVSSLRADVGSLQKSNSIHESGIGSLSKRVTAVESEAQLQVHPAALAQASLPSVFTIVASSRTSGSLGSAFVVSSAAGMSTLVTNFHVIGDVWDEGRSDVEVQQGHESYVGTIVRVSRDDDLAAITVPVALPVLSLDESLPAIGDPVLVIGSPFGLEGTVATGIVSAHRHGYIQFSAPVSPGDSGGPVLKATGSVVAVTVSKVTAHGAEGLSFAIPVSTVCRTVVNC